MKRLSAIALVCVFLIGLAAMAFTRKPTTTLDRPEIAVQPAPAAQDAMYYWYWEPSDTYNDWQSVYNEEFEMWIYYDGVEINTSPEGGTLIEEGYLTNANPHSEFPYYYLYAHFD